MTFLNIAQETAIKYAYKSLKQVTDLSSELDLEDIEESISDLEKAFPGLNLETFE